MTGRPVAAALSVAGSDPSGGAGIQADLKTFAALDVYGCAAITNITVQNSREVRQVMELPPAVVRDQIRAVLDDVPVGVAKIGMVGSAAIAEAVAEALAGFGGEIVFDPVLVASAGPRLTAEKDLPAIMATLGRLVTALTPNLDELRRLTGAPCRTQEQTVAAARTLLVSLPALKAVAVTGGHGGRDDEITDILVCRENDAEEIIRHRHPMIRTANTHGTGCTFASALAAHRLRCGSYKRAFMRAGAFVHHVLAMSASYVTGAGAGGMLHHLWRRQRRNSQSSNDTARLTTRHEVNGK